jgi:hypothetical protein
MLRNRSFVVKMVSDKELAADGTQVGEVVDYTRVADEVTKRVAFLIGCYMAADTLRQIAILSAQTKLK